jgi:hypothetical protein
MSASCLVILWAHAAAAGVEARGNASCPTPREVAEHLEALLATDARRSVPARLHLDEAPPEGPGGGAVNVTLEREGGGDAWHEHVGRGPSCAETAQRVAVIVATWMSPFFEEEPATQTHALPATSKVVSSSPPPPARDASFQPSLRFTGGLVGARDGGVGPFTAVEAAGRPGDGTWGGGLTLGWLGERSAPFATGSVAWSRLLVAASVERAWEPGLWRLEASAGPATGVTFLEGRQLTSNGRTASLDLGISTGLRVGRRLGASSFAVWLGAGVMAWLRPHHVVAAGFPDGRYLPWLDGRLEAGISWARGP